MHRGEKFLARAIYLDFACGGVEGRRVATSVSMTEEELCSRRQRKGRRGGGRDGGAAQGRAAVNLIKVYGGGQFVEIERDLGEDF